MQVRGDMNALALGSVAPPPPARPSNAVRMDAALMSLTADNVTACRRADLGRADTPPKYPQVVGDGGEVGFSPENPPAITEAQLDHVMVGTPKKAGWDGGHAFGAGKGKSEFPESWDRAKVRDVINQVLRTPVEIERSGSTLYFRGTADGQLVTVRVKGRMHGKARIWTAYPGWD